jgi:hypothetical protein
MLHVIAVVNNPERWKSRIALYRQFERHMHASGVHLITVEHAFGERPFEVTSSGNPDHVQVRGGRPQEIWLKEALMNLGVRQNLTRRFPEWRYVAFIDADIEFLRKDWAEETVHELQHVSVLQPWSHSVDLGPNCEVITNENGRDVDRSFCAAVLAGDAHVPTDKGPYPADRRQHCGYAVAMRRETYDGLGGLMDWVITGAADWYMAYAFAEITLPLEGRFSEGYRRRLLEFAERSKRVVKRNIGVVPGTIAHSWHGSKKKRGYVSRQDVLARSNFDPDIDLALDSQGLPFLATDNYELRDGLRQYFKSRNEDSIDV